MYRIDCRSGYYCGVGSLRPERVRERTAVKKLVAGAAALAAGASGLMAQTMDAAGATNAIESLGGVVKHGGSVMIPIMVGVIGIATGVGVYKRFSRKAGVSS